MIIYKEVDKTYFPQYDSIPMRVNVTSIYKVEKINRGLGGFTLVETPVEPYVKTFYLGKNLITQWGERFDLSNWGLFMAFDGDKPVGGTIVAARTREVEMLSGRDDLALMRDLRIDDAYKHQGVGQHLFDMAVKWAREQGLSQMMMECQNNNIPSIKFLHKQGAVLSALDEYAYYNEPEYKHEIQFILYLDL